MPTSAWLVTSTMRGRDGEGADVATDSPRALVVPRAASTSAKNAPRSARQDFSCHRRVRAMRDLLKVPRRLAARALVMAAVLQRFEQPAVHLRRQRTARTFGQIVPEMTLGRDVVVPFELEAAQEERGHFRLGVGGETRTRRLQGLARARRVLGEARRLGQGDQFGQRRPIADFAKTLVFRGRQRFAVFSCRRQLEPSRSLFFWSTATMTRTALGIGLGVAGDRLENGWAGIRIVLQRRRTEAVRRRACAVRRGSRIVGKRARAAREHFRRLIRETQGNCARIHVQLLPLKDHHRCGQRSSTDFHPPFGQRQGEALRVGVPSHDKSRSYHAHVVRPR